MPSIRATQLKSDLAALEDLGAEVRDRVLELLPPDFVPAAADASRLDWIPVPTLVRLLRAVRQVTDEEVLRAWSRAATNLSLETPLFRPILSGAVAIFGRDPQKIYKVMPTAWNAAMKDCGELKVDNGTPGVVVLDLRGVPDAARDRDFLVATAGAFEVVFDECGVDGRCDLEHRRAGDDPRFRARWRPPRS
jgi:hypothetical protein